MTCVNLFVFLSASMPSSTELLTNTLQKKLDQLRKEKDDLEARVMVLQGCASPQQAARQQHVSVCDGGGVSGCRRVNGWASRRSGWS